MLFAISDLHLSFAKPKPMEIFGKHWEGHIEKTASNWRKMVSDGDTVLLAGDTSWAMTTDDFMSDLDWINNLPGRKIIISGNHDYWWSSTSKLNALNEKTFFLKNNFTKYEDIHICGTRGWLCPSDADFTEHDEKIYRREAARLKLSLDAAMNDNAGEIIVMFHYPPKNDKNGDSLFTQTLKQYPVKTVIYGHLHGENALYSQIKNQPNDIAYRLVSCDFLNFIPLPIVF